MTLNSLSRLSKACVLAGVCALLVACGTPMTTPSAPETPVALKPADDQQLAFTWHAVGSQIYECKAGDKGVMAWTFVAPEADLFNDRHDKVGVHGAGPHWAAADGSKVVGITQAQAPGQHAADIPWLLLSAKAHDGTGKMEHVVSVQRVNTQGGKAVAGGCETSVDTGKRLKQPYSADYVFFVAK
jgi:hypothetical protein